MNPVNKSHKVILDGIREVIVKYIGEPVTQTGLFHSLMSSLGVRIGDALAPLAKLEERNVWPLAIATDREAVINLHKYMQENYEHDEDGKLDTTQGYSPRIHRIDEHVTNIMQSMQDNYGSASRFKEYHGVYTESKLKLKQAA